MCFAPRKDAARAPQASGRDAEKRLPRKGRVPRPPPMDGRNLEARGRIAFIQKFAGVTMLGRDVREGRPSATAAFISVLSGIGTRARASAVRRPPDRPALPGKAASCPEAAVFRFRKAARLFSAFPAPGRAGASHLTRPDRRSEGRPCSDGTPFQSSSPRKSRRRRRSAWRKVRCRAASARHGAGARP